MSSFEPAKRYIGEIDTWESVVTTSVIAAVGANLIVTGIATVLQGKYSVVLIIAGLLLCVVSMGLLFFRRLKQLKKKDTIRGFFIIDKTNHNMFQVPGYEMSLIMWLHMMAAIQEREDIVKDWNTERFGEIKYCKENGYHIELIETKANDVFYELLTYCVLQELSSHLLCYFSEYTNKEVITLLREDVPELLQKNRFLDWQSKEKYDMAQEREIMFEDIPPEEKFKKMRALWPKGSLTYSRFEIKMPKGSTLQMQDHKLAIEHSLFSIELECDFSGSNPFIPQGFEEYYLGFDKENNHYKAFQYSVTINVEFKLKALLIKKWKKYYYWIDNFIDRLNEKMSEDEFYKRIGWNTVNTVMICESNTARTKKK